MAQRRSRHSVSGHRRLRPAEAWLVRLTTSSIESAAVPTALTADGIAIACYDLGGTGPDLLLAHATGFCGRMWEPVAARLGDAFHCWALDLRGHGASALPPLDDFSWDGFGLDVRAALETLGLERPYGVGHSLGAASLLMAEERWPGTFEALYVFEPAIHLPSQELVDDGSTWAEMALRRRARFPSLEAARANFAGKPPMNSFDPAVLECYLRHGLAGQEDGSVTLRCRPEMESAVFRTFLQADVGARLGEVSCPVVVASGPRDHSSGSSHESPADHLPKARTEELAGLDHFGPLQRPDVIAASVRRSLLSSRPTSA